MKKITQFFSKLNQKNNAREVKEINNTDYSGSEAALVDNDAGILDITEALDKTILSTNNISSAVSENFAENNVYLNTPSQLVIDFPQNEQKRRFQEKWYNIYSWLEYEVTTDSSFCYICKQYPMKDKEKPTFKTSGFKDWKNAKKFFEIHETSESHKTNQMLHHNRVSVEKSRKSCAALVNSHHAKDVAENRNYLKHIIEIIHFLARQGLAYRGHNENKTSSHNLGNFLELLEFHCKFIPNLKENNASKVAKYTSPAIQNEIIHLISKQIVKLNLPRKYYAIICDETMDLSRKEMLALCLRQVDDSLNIHENFFGFYRAKIQNADSIFNLIKSVLEEELKLDLQLMVAQSFDGAATMAGAKSGVAKRFLEKVPHVVFVHCYAHKLNLALQDATNQIKSVSDVLLIIQNVSVFVERSAKRHALFEHLQGDEKKRTLQNFCTTRWSSRYLALKSFVNLYKYLLTFLEIVDDDNDKSIGATARGFLKQVKTFNFVFYCKILLVLFEKTHILSKFLQKPSNNIVKALELCDITIMELEEMKSIAFVKIFNECKSICEQEDINVPSIELAESVNDLHTNILNPNSKKRKKSEGESNHNFKYREKFAKIVDIYIIEIKNRFPKDELESVIALYNLLMLKSSNEHSNFDYSVLLKYDKFVNIERLQNEISSFINYKIKFGQVNWNYLNIMIENFVEKNLKLIYEEIFIVIKIYLTIPISSAEAERAFSVLKLLKLWLRTSMEDERVSDLGIIKMANDKNIDYDLLIEEFIKQKERRLNLI
jgi:hypothetical protein